MDIKKNVELLSMCWMVIDWIRSKKNRGRIELTCWCWGRDWIVSTTGDLYTFDNAAATWSILTYCISEMLLEI